MNGNVLASILDVKSAILERDSHGVAVILNEVASVERMIESVEANLSAPADGLDTGGALKAALLFESAQAARLLKLRKKRVEVKARLHAAEEKLATALGEKRAVERLVSAARRA